MTNPTIDTANDPQFVELPPCPVCGNDFIEIFGSDKRNWWSGCKPCSRRGLDNHVKAKTRAEAVTKWNAYVRSVIEGVEK